MKDLVVNNELTIYFVPIYLDETKNKYFSVVLDYENSSNVISFITFSEIIKTEERFSECWEDINKIIKRLFEQEVCDTEESCILYQQYLFSEISFFYPESISGSVDRKDFNNIYILR